MKNVFRCAFAICLVVCLARPALSQSRNTGEIRGTVTDPSGAVVPDASVVVMNIDTGVKNDFTTNKDGLYDTVTTPTGNYQITVTAKGFKTFVIGPITLDVAVITEDAKLDMGTPTETVTITASGVPLLQTETGQQGTILESRTMSQLPTMGTSIVGNDWASFNILLAGASSTPTMNGSEGSGSYNAGDAISINGNLPDYANFLQDGAVVQLPVSNNVDNLVLEAVQEVQINTSSFSAEYGVGGAVFNQISKSGTNQFHGSLYEFWQNSDLNASNFFSGTVPFFRYDEYGGSIGGPIIKNKLFFEFVVDKIYDNGGTAPSVSTVPTCGERGLASTSSTACGASLGYYSFAATGLPALYDPTSCSTPGCTRTSFAAENTGSLVGVNAIPAADVDPVALKMLAYYPMPNNGAPGAITNNFIYSNPAANPDLRFFGRIDFDMSPKNKISTSLDEKNNPGDNFGGLPCPMNCGTGDITDFKIQFTDAYTISPTMVNELRMGYTMQGNYFIPQQLGFDPTTELGLAYSTSNDFPTINVAGGGCCVGLGPATNAIYIEHLYDPSDVLTLIKGRHILHFGVEVLMGEGNLTPWGNVNSGTFGFTGAYTAQNHVVGTGAGFADFLLGDVENWNAKNQPVAYGRIKNPQGFAQDDWKIKPNFTINLGLRWQGTTGWTEKNNAIGGFDPTVSLAYPCGTAPNVSCAYEGSLGAMWFDGQDGRNSLEKPVWDIFLPRVGFAWSLMHNTVLRGGFGMYSYNFSQDTYDPGNMIGAGTLAESSGSVTDVNSGTGPTPVVYLRSPISASALGYMPGTNNPASYVNLAKLPGETYAPYNASPGRIREYTASLEHQFGGNFMVEIGYAGSQGSNLQFPMDLNQITSSSSLAAEALAGATIQADRPYPAWGSLGGSTFNAISNYNAMQIIVNKRYSSGLSFSVNYVWSHFMDDQDSSGWGSHSGTQIWQLGNDPAANYGNSNFNVPNALKGNVIYELPFGHGKPFLSTGTVANEIVGGWQISGTFIAQSGNPFTVTDSGPTNYSEAGSIFPDVIGNPYTGTCPNGAAAHTLACWLNPAAFADPAPGTFGDEQRNSLVGPRLTVFNLSLSKNFSFSERFKLQLRIDLTNAFNHPSFGVPGTTYPGDSWESCSGSAKTTCQTGILGNFGEVNASTQGGGIAVSPRSGQLSARFSF